MRLLDILMAQPDSALDSTSGPQPWHPPPFLANPDQTTLNVSEDAATPTEVFAFLKSVYLPVPQTA